MKRRALVIPLAGIMLAVLAVPALAEEITLNNDVDPQQIEVKGRYSSGGTETPTVYSVDIEWGSMIFEYSEKSVRTWHPETHTYSEGAKSGAWRPAEKKSNTELNSNMIKITNHSNTNVTCSLDFQAQPWFSADFNPSANFSKNSFTLETADGRSLENADTTQVSLDITAKELTEPLPDGYFLGTISVTVR